MKTFSFLFLSLFLCFDINLTYAYDGITYYGAEITPADRVNSNGVRLTTVRDILRQDRANYYVYGNSGRYDQPDDFFSSKSHRAIFDTARINISPQLAQRIIYSNQPVLISVFVYSTREISVEAGLPNPNAD